jgi:AraC family transcriptional regulator
MYFTSLPDHTKPEFDEQLHFSKFKKHNIIFNAHSNYAFCDNHVGCLSFKTVLSGEEWYRINNHRLANRPGQFLILNDDQTYSCRIDNNEKVRVLSVFFKKEFASSVFSDALRSEEVSLDNPFNPGEKTLEFFQTLYSIDDELRRQLSGLVASLDGRGYDSCMMDEYLVFLLHYLIRIYKSESNRAKKVNALKSSTRTEIYKRLCIAKDVLHSSFMDNPDLNAISDTACLSVPQLVRQFKSVFQTTPHQYLIKVRLKRAAELLKLTKKPVHEITWMCGFENVSAFCRAFRSEYGVQPVNFRKMSS